MDQTFSSFFTNFAQNRPLSPQTTKATCPRPITPSILNPILPKNNSEIIGTTTLVNHLAITLATRCQSHRRRRAERRPVPDEYKDGKYFERRTRNNCAAKKSRDARKIREDDVAQRVNRLEQHNAVLRAQVTTLREEANSLRELVVARKKKQQQQQQNDQQQQQQQVFHTNVLPHHLQQALLFASSSSMQISPISPLAPANIRDLLGYNNFSVPAVVTAVAPASSTVASHQIDFHTAGDVERKHDNVTFGDSLFNFAHMASAAASPPTSSRLKL